MQAFVPKNRRPKFDLHLRIIDLNNVPLVSGTSFIKWHLPHSTAAEHRGRTSKNPIKEHKVVYDHLINVPIRLTIDKTNMLQESWIHFEVLQEYGGSGRGERITLGNIKLNLAEYVEQSEQQSPGGDGGEEGVVRRYLMQDSKINSTLKISIFMKQLDGDRNFVAPPLKTAPVFGGIAGIMSGEQGEPDDPTQIPSLASTSVNRQKSELQDLYRRTLTAAWSSQQPGELRADECVENIFAGGDGWGDKDLPYTITSPRSPSQRLHRHHHRHSRHHHPNHQGDGVGGSSAGESDDNDDDGSESDLGRGLNNAPIASKAGRHWLHLHNSNKIFNPTGTSNTSKKGSSAFGEMLKPPSPSHSSASHAHHGHHHHSGHGSSGAGSMGGSKGTHSGSSSQGLEHQAHMLREMELGLEGRGEGDWRKRSGGLYGNEVDEFEIRDDLRSWRVPSATT
ncbi:hypothetical protein K402DRAFT_394987 [Aulographum hederae CBS 113979]|uniref:C2 NT-type domain-containing protein n=1 Tax=Aulographum hederae CBS 113979 TaxID=1176131 RepID=A0A6G1GWZ2_9PEZI|nr:hypothetical protein K402DRAFT_394987 [Aulographum hederae CBS 113979]